MTRWWILAVVLMGTWGGVQAQQVGHTFLRRYNLPDIQTGLSLATLESGGFVATGQHFNNGSYGECDVYVYRVDDCGNRLWFNLYGTTASEGGRSILPLSDGGFLVSGARVDLSGAMQGSGMMMRLNPNGAVDWFHMYDGLQWMFEARELTGGFVAVANDGQVPVVLQLDDAGDVQWATRLEGMAEMALALEVLPDGGILFATNDVLSNHDVEVARLASDGTLQWATGFGAGYFPGPNDQVQWGCDLMTDGEDHVYVTSPTQGAGIGGKDILVLKLEADNGDIVWSRGMGSEQDDTGRSLVQAGTGVALVGSSMGYDVSTLDDPDALSEDLTEENILLARFDASGFVTWSRIYGGNGKERGVDLEYDEALGYTVSAYTTSPVFGCIDNQPDPLFIRTDLEGGVGCQSADVTLVSIPIPVTATELDVIPQSIAITVVDEPVVVTPLEPLDEFQCESCFNQPVCEAASPAVCLGDSVQFLNQTQIGLSCFQEWVIEGPEFAAPWVVPADAEPAPTWAPASPGTYTAILRSTCPDMPTADTVSVFVSALDALPPVLSDFNGFPVPCSGGSGGVAEGQSALGYQVGGPETWLWVSTAGDTLPWNALTAGTFTGFVTDAAGCTDSTTVTLTAPPVLAVGATVVSDFNGYDVSCADSTDGAIQLLPSGGVPGYAWAGTEGNWLVDTLLTAQAGANVVAIEDANGCGVTDTIVLSAPVPPSMLLAATLDSCGAGVGTVSVGCIGEVTPLSVVWPAQADVIVELGVDSVRWEAVSGGTYAVAVQDANGCVTVDSILVPVSETPLVTFHSAPSKVCYPDAEMTFTDDTEGAILSRRWDFGDGRVTEVPNAGPNANEVRHTFQAPGLFEVVLEVVNGIGCSASEVLVTEVLQGVQVFVPSAFTPNNDGVNDGFSPVLSGVDEFRWQVFDRWGLPLFESRDLDRKWNGSLDNLGRSHMNELFTWRLEAQGECQAVRVFQGQVQLIR